MNKEQLKEKARAFFTVKNVLKNMAQLAVLVLLVWGISKFQTRDLLGTGETAPPFTLQNLAGQSYTLPKDKKVIVYFFAPWCSVCRFSSHNIVSVREAKSPGDLDIVAVGLSWQSLDELRDFKVKHSLNVPVLAGNDDILEQYRITSFPTIYIIEKGKVKKKVVGYTTELGIRLRSL